MSRTTHLALGPGFDEVSATNPLPVALGGSGLPNSESNPIISRLQNANGAAYFAFGTAYAGYATPTDMMVLKGSATKIVRVNAFQMLIASNAATLISVNFIKRSAANTGGTASQPTVSKTDSADAAATAVLDLYSVVPASLGAGATLYRQTSLTAALTAAPIAFSFTNGLNANVITLPKPMTLRGVAESLAFNFGGAALPAGFAANYQAVWTESDA